MGYIYLIFCRVSDNLFKNMVLQMVNDHQHYDLNVLAKYIVEQAVQYSQDK